MFTPSLRSGLRARLSSPARGGSSGYRPALDGMRAISLLAIMLYHLPIHQIVDDAKWLCPKGTHEDTMGGVKMRFDGVHYSKDGTAKFWAWLAPQLERWIPAI